MNDVKKIQKDLFNDPMGFKKKRRNMLHSLFLFFNYSYYYVRFYSFIYLFPLYYLFIFSYYFVTYYYFLLFISYLLIYFYLLQHLDVRDRNHARQEKMWIKKYSISFASYCFSFSVISAAFFLLQFDVKCSTIEVQCCTT